MTTCVKPTTPYQFYGRDGGWVIAFPVAVEGVLVTAPLVGSPGELVYLLHDRLTNGFHWRTAEQIAAYPTSPIEQPVDKLKPAVVKEPT